MDSRLLSPCIRHPASCWSFFFFHLALGCVFPLIFLFPFFRPIPALSCTHKFVLSPVISLTKSVNLQWISSCVISSVTSWPLCVIRFTRIVMEYPVLAYGSPCALSYTLPRALPEKFQANSLLCRPYFCYEFPIVVASLIPAVDFLLHYVICSSRLVALAFSLRPCYVSLRISLIISSVFP